MCRLGRDEILRYRGCRKIVLQVVQLDTTHIAATHRATPAQIAIAWCFHQPGITAAIVGARNPQQAIENAQAARIALSAGEITRLSEAFSGC